ncbi:MAG TPA: hypothetical protein VK204_14895 [Nocardioidaceae bacterium]|nr:hypothetical protein [Nocardioidaceae bacterium]
MRPPWHLPLLRGLVVTVLVFLLGACAVLPDDEGAASGSRPAPAVTASEAGADFPASDVLRRWDRARARAFADGDVAALRRLYVEGSAAGTADVRLLRGYLRRGLRVGGMRMQLLALEVVREGRGRLVLRVTDRLTGAVAVDGRTRMPLPQDAASTRVVELRRPRPDMPWRVASVRESAPRPAAR